MANLRVSQACAADLAYFLQEKGLCEEFVRWYDESPPIERLLAKSAAARDVRDLLQEGHRRGYDTSAVVAELESLREESS
jgi:hypothetical protein